MPVLDQDLDASALRRFRGFIFDCDGVLIDSFVANVAYYNMFRSRFGLPPMGPEDEMYTHTQNVFNSIQRIVPPEHYEAAMEYRKLLNYRDILPHLRREPGILGLLSWLRAARFFLGVNTNRTDTTDMVFEALDLNGYFQPVMTAGIAPRPKPDPGGMHAILNDWGLSAAEVVFIGDSDVDEQTALNAGVSFWAYKNPALAAELHVPDFETLLLALRRAWPELSTGLQGA
ncbi:MAG: HAD family hydrolase [Proteobacteria bacterium]|nr:HAD family hydrolase [Pseudomonadota bacterium]MBU1594741.1 HAD family hydrolase [Pseudomonadota bacterium]